MKQNHPASTWDGQIGIKEAQTDQSESCLFFILRWFCGCLFSSGRRDRFSVDESRLLDHAERKPTPPRVYDESENVPGSDLQAAIALSLQLAGIRGEPTSPECVICLDDFTDENPRMPTICSCGIGLAGFHKQCLKRWLAKRGACVCPSCDQPIFFEENSSSQRPSRR